MERKILLTEGMFTGLCKMGSMKVENDIQISFTSREITQLCKGEVLDKSVIGWTENINFKFALQDIGFDMINEILKRSPLFGDLAGNFLNK
jgi:hypothetical protein